MNNPIYFDFFFQVDDLAYVWCEWVELELSHEEHEKAITLLRRATAPPPRRISYHDKGETVQMRLHKSLKIWSLYADLEESFGTFQTAKAVYERILELKIPTPQIIINYGMFLKDHKYFEEAFKAYEKGNFEFFLFQFSFRCPAKPGGSWNHFWSGLSTVILKTLVPFMFLRVP